MADVAFDLVKFKRVGNEELLIQLTFWLDRLQLPYTGIVERKYMFNFVRPETPTDYLYAKVRPFSEVFKARLAKSRNQELGSEESLGRPDLNQQN